MKAIVFLAVFSLYTLSQSAPVDPDEEVELVPAVKTAIEEDYEDNNGFIPIFVIRRTSGSPFLGGGNANFPFSGFAGFNPFDIFGSQPRDDDQEQFIPSIFDTPTTVIEENDENDDGNGHPCGFLCTILKDFDTKLREIQDEVRDLHEQTNETEGNQEQDGFDVNNSTYTEKVLPDGTVVKINRTVISDSSDDGSSFYFHSTSLHNFDQSKEPEEEAKEEPQEPEIEVESELDDEDFEEFPEAVTEVEIPMLDEALNEVPENERFKRSDPFSQQQLVFRLPHPNMIRMSSTASTDNWKPLHSDTLVNDIVTNNGKRGSLIRIEPDSEFIRENPNTGNIESVSIEHANLWNQQAI